MMPAAWWLLTLLLAGACGALTADAYRGWREEREKRRMYRRYYERAARLRLSERVR